MKSVLISIRPKWCELIASGEKTIEVRKTRPKLKTPFKCYIYCTKGDTHKLDGHHTNACREKFWIGKPLNNLSGGRYVGNSKVIGEFVCDAIYPISVTYADPNNHLARRDFPFTGMTDKKIMDYLGNGEAGYGWHISDLVIYDEPKELSEFRKPVICHRGIERDNCVGCWDCEIKRPPQSWCYVEELR